MRTNHQPFTSLVAWKTNADINSLLARCIGSLLAKRRLTSLETAAIAIRSNDTYAISAHTDKHMGVMALMDAGT